MAVAERIEGPVTEPRAQPTAEVRTRNTLARWGGGLLAAGAALKVAGVANRALGKPTAIGGVLGEAAGMVGRGLLAGFIGTIAITLSSALEQEIRERRKARESGQKRPPGSFYRTITGQWLYAADAAGKVLGVAPTDDHAKERFSRVAHFGYGTTWGASLGILGLAGVRGPLAGAAMLGGVLGTEMLIMPAAKFFPPPAQWGRQAVTSSIVHHAVYAMAAVLVFDAIQHDSTLQ